MLQIKVGKSKAIRSLCYKPRFSFKFHLPFIYIQAKNSLYLACLNHTMKQFSRIPTVYEISGK